MVRSRAVRTLVVSLLCIAPGGCFDFPSTSAPSDAGSDSPSQPTPDGGGDDAGGATGSDAGTFSCASLKPQPTFCDDFDGPSEPRGWDLLEQTNGQVTVDSLAIPPAPSMPNSLLAAASAAAGTEADALKQFSTYAGEAVHITASFEMNVQQVDSSPSGQIIAFEVIFKNSSSTFNQIVLNLNSLGSTGGVSAQIAENAQGVDGGEAGYNSYPLPDHPPTKAWTKVDVDLVVASPNGSAANKITVTLDGKTELDQQALQNALQGGSPWVHLGIGYEAPGTSGWAVRYDNFVFDISKL